MKKTSILNYLICLALLVLFGCSQEKTESKKNLIILPTTNFTCGPLSCVTENEYCFKVFAAVVQPGTDGITYTCEELPHADCVEIEKTGKCFGSREEGITLELYLP